MGGVEVNECVHTYSMRVRTTVYGCGRGLRGRVGVELCACDMINIINHVHVHLAWLGGVGRGWLGAHRWGRAVWTLWGGVSGHSVNLRDQCSVCDAVTVQQWWMRRSSRRSRS